MKFFRLFMNVLVLLALPALVFPGAPRIPFGGRVVIDTLLSQQYKSKQPPFTYDEMMRLLEDIESGNVDKYSDQDLIKINYFLCLFSREGMLSDDSEKNIKLEQDIYELLDTNDSLLSFAPAYEGEWRAIPAIYFDHADAILCRSWFKKKWDSTRKFVKEHKTEIIIGMVVVVAVVTIAVIVSATAAASAVTAASGAAAGCAENSSGQQDRSTYNNSPESHQESALPEIPVDSAILQEVVRDNVDSFKEMLVENNFVPSDVSAKDPTFLDKARQMSSYLAHETLEGVSQITGIVPELLSAAEAAGKALGVDRILKQDPNIPELPDPMESHEKMIASGHEQIDKFFSTNQAHRYEQDEEPLVQFSYGALPPPGVLAQMERMPPTQVSSVCGWEIGDPIINRTFSGKTPKWSTVRARYWKNRAEQNSSDYKPQELERMKNGLAPQRFNDKTGIMESKELHHIPSQREGGLFDVVEVWPEEHAELDKFRRLGEK